MAGARAAAILAVMNVMRASGIGLVLSAGVMLAWWAAPPAVGRWPIAGADAPRMLAPAALTSSLPAPADVVPGRTPVGEPQPVHAAVPPGVTTAQWVRLSADAATLPGGAAELQRLANYLAWADALQRFRSARGAGVPTLELAREVDAGLDERLRQREVSAAEGQRIKSAVLDITEPDAGSREHLLRAWATATLPRPAVDARQAPFEQRQAEIVAAWSARPPAARDAAALQRELDALRMQVFSPPAPSAVAQQESPK